MIFLLEFLFDFVHEEGFLVFGEFLTWSRGSKIGKVGLFEFW